MSRSRLVRNAAALTTATIVAALSSTAAGGSVVIDSFDSPQPSFEPVGGNGIWGQRSIWSDLIGFSTGGVATSASADIHGNGAALFDLQATATATAESVLFIEKRLEYNNADFPIVMDGGSRLTLKGFGTSARTGNSTMRIFAAVNADQGNSQYHDVVLTSGAIGDIHFDFSGIAAITRVWVSFSIIASGGEASLIYDLDEITISPIPAPAAAPLLALAGLTVRGRRRR